VIHHAPALAVRALAVAVIQPAFGAALMAPTRRPQTRVAREMGARARAVDVPPVTPAADREGL
jgi:hypothetical protein